MPKKIIVCLDGSLYSDSILALGSFVAKSLALPLTLLHVAEPHLVHAASSDLEPDLCGAIGLGAKTVLLEKISASDEAHGKKEQHKGSIILSEALDTYQRNNTNSNVDTLHVRGDFIETILELEDETALVIVGKRGEHHQENLRHLGSNVKDLVRSIKLPILVATKTLSLPIERFMLLCDNDEETRHIIDFISKNPFLHQAECRLMLLHQTDHHQFSNMLEQQQISVQIHNPPSCSLDMVPHYLNEHHINLLVTRSYRHSRIYDFLFTGQTNTLLHNTNIPLLLL